MEGNRAQVLMIDGRYFYGIINNRIRTAWSLPAAMLFAPNDEKVKKAEKILIARGKKPRRVTILPVQTCGICGCTNDRACKDGCRWIAPDLCSRCQDFVRGR